MVYEYKLTCYDRETREGRVFADYINTFLNLKTKANGYPDCVRIPADEEQ